MNWKIVSGSLCLSWGILLSAQQLTENLRLIPGGIEIVERENAATSAFDPRQRLKTGDQRVLIDFMDLSSSKQSGKLKTDPKTGSQEGTIEAGREKLPFFYTSHVKKSGRRQVCFSFRIQREKPGTLKECFVSLRLNRALLDVPLTLGLAMSADRVRNRELLFPLEKKGGWIWSTSKEQNVHSIRIPLHRGELVVSGVSAPAMACKYGSGMGNLRLYLQHENIKSVGAELTISYEPYHAETLDLKPVMNMGFRDERADDKKGGWTDQGPENDLRMMKSGKQTFINIPFDVVDPTANKGKSVLAFACPERPYFAEKATIPVQGKRFRWLYLLHADAWGKKKEVGTLQVNYQDGETLRFSIVDGRDVANWWDPKSAVNAAVAWKGQNRNAFLGLYISRFPVKDKPIHSLELISSNQSVWLVLAISGVRAEHPPFPAPEAEAVEVPVTMDPRDWQTYSLTVERKHPVRNSALDFSFLLDAPAGKYGFLKSEGENFVFERRPGVPVRFNGANLCEEIATRYTKEEAEKLADRIASLGINAVRLHHFDRDLVDSEKSDGSVNPERLDHLHYLVYAMKKRGIYVTLDLYTVRTTGFPEKFKDMFDVKSRMIFSPELRSNLMNFARSLLTPVNPYTGLALKDDPALIFLGLINEDPTMTIHDQYKYPNSDPVRHRAIQRAFESYCAARNIPAPEKPDREHYARFLNDHHIQIYREMTAALRKMGVRQMTSDISCSANSITAIPRKTFDYVDNHFYFSHPRTLGNEWGFPNSYSNESMTTVLFDNMTRAVASRIKNKPMTITEFNFCAPNTYRHEGGLAMGSLAAFQNLGGIFVFEYASYTYKTRWNTLNRIGGHLGWFGISVDPIRFLTQRVIALLYLRGDVKQAPADGQEVLTITPEDYKLPQVQNYSFYRLAKDAAIPAKFHSLAFYTKIAMDAAEHVPSGSRSLREMLSGKPLNLPQRGKGIYRPDQGKIVSSTGEISLDAAAKTLRVVTPKSEGFTVTGKSAEGKCLSVSGSSTLCSVFAGTLDGRTLAETSRALILHLTDIQAAGRKKTALGNRQIVYNWGKMDPYLLRKGKAEISLKNAGKGRVKIRVLDVNGAILGEVPFRESNGMVTFTADTSRYGAMAYEFLRFP